MAFTWKWRTPRPAADVTAPTLASVLDARSVPAPGAFSSSGTASTVSGVNVTGSTVALTHAYLAFDGSKSHLRLETTSPALATTGPQPQVYLCACPMCSTAKNAVRFDAASVRIGRTTLVGGARGAV